jgi:LytR cell envelope-related transcriptional attenuator
MKKKSATRPKRGSRLGTLVLVMLTLVVGASLLARYVLRTGRSRPPQVQVLNGAGVADLAQQAARQLRNRGVDVVAIGNADSHDYEETLVLVRRGSKDVARQVRDALGHGTVLEQRDPSLLVDVTVILGSDYAPSGSR